MDSDDLVLKLTSCPCSTYLDGIVIDLGNNRFSIEVACLAREKFKYQSIVVI